MLVEILKTFPHSKDGISIEVLKSGTTAEVRDDLLAGLRKEGYVGQEAKGPLPQPPSEDEGAVDKKPPAPTGDRTTREEGAAGIEIPEKWGDLPWNEQKKLAGAVSKTKITDGKSVTAAIEQELAWRAEDDAAAAAQA